ncbi:unnamed protein product [Protopolystoma xenopodis]|uniref:Uncharacterized protein n=1 Tax=Protopolystoma xenopodis TaxID=117903 RepID=A0A448WVL9_9PLAT|nr:unnamed protein product [Protopolystoma xenopodis]
MLRSVIKQTSSWREIQTQRLNISKISVIVTTYYDQDLVPIIDHSNSVLPPTCGCVAGCKEGGRTESPRQHLSSRWSTGKS